MMKILQTLKSRFPRLYPASFVVVTFLGIGGYSAYERFAASDDCCYPGSPCCHPGAACCAKHAQQQQAQAE